MKATMDPNGPIHRRPQSDAGKISSPESAQPAYFRGNDTPPAYPHPTSPLSTNHQARGISRQNKRKSNHGDNESCSYSQARRP